MKIVFNVLCLSYGGAEKNLCIVANELVKRGYDITICNLNTIPTVQKTDERIKIIDVPKFNTKFVKRLQQLNYIRKVLKEEKADVCVSFLFIPNFLATLAGKLAHVPVIVSERADPNQHKDKVGRFIYYFYRFAEGAVFQTNGAKECFPLKLQKKSVVIPNPVIIKDETIFADYVSAKKKIAFSGRFEVKQKRQDIMLDAFKIVCTKYPEYILDFYGDGPDEEKIKQYAKELGIENNVRFNGVSKQVLKDISDAELFVLSSDFEGIPNVLLEAMTIGLPCISTDCSPGGARMLINNEENGLIVPCGDSIQLSDAIIRMIENREFAISCGKKAVSVKERFDMNKTIDAWENFIIKTAKEKK